MHHQMFVDLFLIPFLCFVRFLLGDLRLLHLVHRSPETLLVPRTIWPPGGRVLERAAPGGPSAIGDRFQRFGVAGSRLVQTFRTISRETFLGVLGMNKSQMFRIESFWIEILDEFIYMHICVHYLIWYCSSLDLWLSHFLTTCVHFWVVTLVLTSYFFWKWRNQCCFEDFWSRWSLSMVFPLREVQLKYDFLCNLLYFCSALELVLHSGRQALQILFFQWLGSCPEKTFLVHAEHGYRVDLLHCSQFVFVGRWPAIFRKSHSAGHLPSLPEFLSQIGHGPFEMFPQRIHQRASLALSVGTRRLLDSVQDASPSDVASPKIWPRPSQNGDFITRYERVMDTYGHSLRCEKWCRTFPGGGHPLCLHFGHWTQQPPFERFHHGQLSAFGWKRGSASHK